MKRLLALALVLTGCGGQLAPTDEDELKIGFVPKSLNQEYWVNTEKGAQAGAKGKAKLLTKAAGADTEIVEQIDLVENLLAQDVDALVIAPSDSDLLKPVLEKAARRIPVVLFDSDIKDWKPKTAYVGTENKQGGVKAGEYIAKLLKNEGELAIVSGIPGSQVGIDRVDGVKEGLKKAGAKTKIVKEVTGQFDREQAVGAMEDILQTNPDVDAVFAANDQMALGAIEAIAARKKTDQIKLIGFDGALEATQRILEGKMYATIAQDPYGMAKVGVESAIKALNDEQVKPTVDTGAKLVTPENAERYFEEVRGKLGGTGRGLDG
ncbi:sugar ABC transporter substrate-binding protein [Solirubrobacter sp. CPCC 204708]|uniref:Sugar ABC transporter substrate-binding protein n=1 Tax=Solirubrobacter deserti TaxID=2282478 RepID=A0ABT4RL79_9ACTN|nr:sugar ABC transporter substrate-binding protein [Solirubrobacter deserti]MBE2318959.1 sugar ABC transporter substrate-binding protein [Solirubrobacter deserti]MDA0139316.1 sugar ABC transporter substrate-binding protein [Solirubrobacter deserti]